MANPFLTAALNYAEKHKFSVIPLKPGQKTPLIQWEPFQSRIATRTEITSWWSNNPKANIGIITGKISNLFVVDLDKYAEGYDEEMTSEYIPDSTVTPSVNTPRGGQHLYFLNPEGSITIKARILPGIDYRGTGGYVVAPPSVNGTGRPYSWVEGMDLGTPLSSLPDAFLGVLGFPNLSLNDAYLNSIRDTNNTLNRGPQNHDRPQLTTPTTTDHRMFEYGTRDDDLYHTANCLTKGRMKKAEQAQILERLILSWGENPDPKWIQAKIESAFKRVENKERSISAEVREWVLTTTGHFLTTDGHKELDLTTRDHKKVANMAFLRLEKEGIIEKHGDKRGCYRVKEDQADEIDIWNANVRPLPIKYPLGIEQFVNTYAKNVIVVAGAPDSGKTAFLLNFAHMNMDKCKVIYFSSEMGAEELRTRLLKFGMDMDSWRKVTWKERASNFADVIDPCAVNIIDFLEIHDEFYKIGGIIKTIFDRLTSGIAVIGLQKPKGRDEGLGGERGLEKPRLYLSIDSGRLKIVKAKNWISDQVNPNGHFIEWKLGGGCNFKPTGPWKKDAKDSF